MTYEQFWTGDPWMTRAYSQAHLLKRKMANEDSWILGGYIARAVSVAISNSFSKHGGAKYLNEPLKIFPKTEAEEAAEVRENKRKLIEYLNSLKIGKK